MTSAITTFGGLAPFSAPCSVLSFIEHFLLKKNTSFPLSKICTSNKTVFAQEFLSEAMFFSAESSHKLNPLNIAIGIIIAESLKRT